MKEVFRNSRRTATKGRSTAGFIFPYHTCRNISGPEDKEDKRQILAGHAPALSFIKLEDNENVREYLVDAKGKQRRSPTLVHQAIRKTLRDTPDIFSILNGGICIVCNSAEIDEKNRRMILDSPSIINGSQTQGELERYLMRQREDDDFMPSVTFEIIVTSDEDLVAEISIARNFQNDVRPISIAGRRGQLDELEDAFRKVNPSAKLRKSETDLSDEYIDTEKLIQVLLAISPNSIWDKMEDSQMFKNKAFTYSQKTRCLKLFQRIAEDKENPKYEKIYKFFLHVAPAAWQLYGEWKRHPGFEGCALRSIQRGPNGTILEVPDGIIFPIIASLSTFAVEKKGKWKIRIPSSFDPTKLIEVAVADYKEVASSNPQLMGKSRACYSRLHSYTSLYADLLPGS